MKKNNIKEVWKSGINSNIKSYSESELNKIVIKSARKSMKRIQLGGLFQLIIIAIVIYVMHILIFRNNSIEMKLLYIAELIILLGCSLQWKYSDYKMNMYTSDKPVKEWLEYRINEINRKIYLMNKYGLSLAVLIGFGFHIAHQIILKIHFNPFVSGGILVGLIIYLVLVTRPLNKKLNKALKELKELYKQYEE